MMTIKVTGLSEAIRLMDTARSSLTAEMGKAMRESVRDLHRQAVREAPVNKQSGGGNLRQMIDSSSSATRGTVISRAKYSEYVHEGTRPHIIRPKRARVLANRRTGQFFGRKVNHPGTRPNPYLKRALGKVKKKITENFNSAIKRLLK